MPGAGKPEQGLSFRLRILNELIDHDLLLRRAAQEQIAISSDEINSRLNQIRNPDSSTKFQKLIQEEGLTPAQLRTQVEQGLTIQKLIHREISSRIEVSAAEIAAYYARNKADFTVPTPEYHLAQILVTPIADPEVRNLMHDDARTERAAERKIRALYNQLRSGEDFGKVAEEYSEDPRTAPGGGDMGFVPMPFLESHPRILRAVRSLKPGNFSGIIHGHHGFRIIELLGFVPAGQRSLSDPLVRKAIRKTLLDEKAEVLKAAYIENLRDQAHIVNKLAQKIVNTAGSAEDIH